jgi:deoxyribodipyrimidine photo-lyase
MDLFLGIIAFLTTIIIFFLNVFIIKDKTNIYKSGGMSSPSTGLFIFHRDLRIVDNTALIELSKQVDFIIPLFIFDDRQITNNTYKSNLCVNFMIESLIELSDDISKQGGHLNFINGDTTKIIKQIIKNNNIAAIGFTLDYTPFAKSRDNEIINLCNEANINIITSHDCLLLGKPVSKENGEIYKVFTPFHNAFKDEKIQKPDTTIIKNFSNVILPNTINDITNIAIISPDKNPAVRGGRVNGLKILNNTTNQQEYNKNRNTLSYNTTHLSAYNKFGIVSIREVYQTFAKLPNTSLDLIKQLFWRDFYYNIMNSDPNALNGNYNPKFNTIKWRDDPAAFEAWKSGNTGFPIVDACMRELNNTGIMHNRGRMIVADFLIKILRINWRDGEKYFATNLIDYDPAMNNYNWQWVAGTGAFSQPYFRVFNPWTQSLKYDPDCEYIYKWIPELKSVPKTDIHNWNIKCNKFQINYPSPIIDYEKARESYLKEIKLQI